MAQCVKDPTLSLQWLGSLLWQVQSLAWELPHFVGVAKKKKSTSPTEFFLFYLFAFSRASPAAYGGSQARGLIRATTQSEPQNLQNTSVSCQLWFEKKRG